MVEFVTLFLALAAGPIEVELAVEGDVAAIALELDGREVARLEGPPWRREVDLGERLRPHRLAAVALDADGLELDRTTRFLNVYRPPAEVDYVLHRNRKGWLTMLELSWPDRGAVRPGRFAVSVDGQGVEADDAGEIWVPPLDPRELHVIETVVEYSDGSVARDWLGFGGPRLAGGSARLTPAPLTVSDRSVGLGADEVTASSRHSGTPVPVVAVESGEVETIFVRDALASRALGALAPRRQVTGSLSGARDAGTARLIHAVALRPEEWVRVLDPGVSGRPSDLDPHRTAMRLTADTPGKFGLFWHLRERDEDAHLGAAWISDGLAIAATRLATGGRRGATVLVLTPDSSDELSRFTPADVTAYLDSLDVPLEVWYLGKASSASDDWGEATEVRSIAGMERAMDALRARLDRQRIVWLEGIHLPGEVELSPIESSSAR